jgi:hypothetical protein
MHKRYLMAESHSGGARKILVCNVITMTDTGRTLDVNHVVHISEILLPDGRMANVPTADPAFVSESISQINLDNFMITKYLDPVVDKGFISQYENIVNSAKAKMAGIVMPNRGGIITE